MSEFYNRQRIIDIYASANDDDYRKINLIKAYRFCSGEGLKEAKEAIEAHPTLPQTLKLFSRHLSDCADTTLNLRDESSEILSEQILLDKKIIKGINTACNVWKEMGYKSSLQACQAVLNNLTENS